jgi:hypothetical protein
MVLPTYAAIMVLLMLYQALARLGIYLQKRVQLVLLDLRARLDLRERLEHKVRVDHKGTQEYKVLPALRGQQVPLALKET